MHGLLEVVPCHILQNMESSGSINRKDQPFTEASTFFLSAIHNVDGAAEKTGPKAKTAHAAVRQTPKQRAGQIPLKTSS